MIAALICALSVPALLHFFVAYCRSITAATRKVELSEGLLKLAGLQNKSMASEDFDYFFGLIHLCPEYRGDRGQIFLIGVYRKLLDNLGWILCRLLPSGRLWFERERESCSYVAAVALDRRISHSRELFAQQASGRL